MNELGQLCHPRAFVYCTGLYEPDDDNYRLVKAFSEFGLKDLATKTEMVTFAKTLLPYLNKGNKKYKISARVPARYYGNLYNDFILEFVEIRNYYMNTNINLQDW